MKRLITALAEARNVGCLTGAGISTLCGIPDFRGPEGLYRQPNAERIFDIDWFDRDPSIYYKGCEKLVYGLDAYEPGPVHRALKKLEDLGLLKGISTQNIDMLHQKAGSRNVYEVHGSPIVHHCRRCGAVKTYREILEQLRVEEVPHCACGGVFKPNITFFGEALPEVAFQKSIELAEKCDVYLVLGSSLTVFPAARLPELAVQNGAKLFIVNAQQTPLDRLAEAKYDDLTAFSDIILEENWLFGCKK